jgi:mRNA interferase MazF
MYKRGDIILVNLNPQKNNEAGKIRPCVVISETAVNEILDLITIIPCSTNLLGEGLFRIVLNKREKLDKNCEVMIEQIKGVSKKRVIEPLSYVTSDEISKIEKGVKALLGV